jgi:hypothetical protein
MAEAVVDFVWSQPHLRPHAGLVPPLAAVAAAAGGDPLGPLTLVMARQAASVYALKWLDDPYSIDLAERFAAACQRPQRQAFDPVIDWLPYSTGGFWVPNPPEEMMARFWMQYQVSRLPGQRPLLVLPTVDKPARRFLRALAAVDPVQVRSAVAVTGDSISFNVIYRDREWAWNGQELPVPLVFFCHQDPTAWPDLDPDAAPPPHASATDDELLNAELVRVLLEAAYPTSGQGRGPLLTDADALAQRLHGASGRYFDASGNRRGGSGEYVVCRLPHIEDGQVRGSATIEVWHRPLTTPPRWRQVRPPLRVTDTRWQP